MSKITSTIDIYDGRTCIGQVVERDKGKRCEAYTAAGQEIGVFPSHKKAARAVCEAARQQPSQEAA
jgi:hypothetical protein